MYYSDFNGWENHRYDFSDDINVFDSDDFVIIEIMNEL